MRLNAEQMETLVKQVIAAQVDKTLEPIDAEFLTASWARMMESGTGVAYGSESGFLLAIHCQDLMTGKRKAFEYLWLLYPEKRGGRAAVSLLAEFEAGAALDGCVAAVVGSSGYRPKALARWYRQLGYESISESFQKRI